MCGIFGAAFSDGIQPDRLALLRAGCESLRHRGPDNGGEALWEGVFFGHRRLSIIDLSAAANQPLHAKDAPASLIFNGEIYNFRELAARMTGFTSASDSETLLEGYLRYGTDFFKRLRGIYAFAIFDRRQMPRILLARDPAGIKPLYLHLGARQLMFGSEIKALWPLLKSRLNIDERVLKAYLHLGYCPEPHTIYREIQCLLPGHFLEVNVKTFAFKRKPFFVYDFQRGRPLSLAANLDATASHLAVAVDRNLVADVPVSLSLSGGIDSSLIFAQANRHRPTHPGLTVSFSDQSYDESPVAQAFAKHLGAPHQRITAEMDGSLNLLERVFLHFDQPYADSSALPFYFLAKAARRRSKVLIGGDGGDEIHDGYLGFGILPFLWRIGRPPILSELTRASLELGAYLAPAGRARQMRRLAGVLGLNNPLDRLFEWTAWLPTATGGKTRSPFLFDPQDGLDLCREGWDAPEHTAADVWVRRFYFQQRMRSDYLRKADMMSMFHGLEYRVPMLDEDLVQHGLRLPPNQKAGLRSQKKILRQLHQRIYPPALSKRAKTGFTIPLDTWLGHTHLETIRARLLDPGAFVQQWIDPAYLRQLFDPKLLVSAAMSRAARYQRLLILYNLENWHEKIYATR